MTIDGGVNAQRGFQFQAWSLLFYYLLRKIESPQLDLILEPEMGEDGMLLFGSLKNGKGGVREFIQCKKRESGGGGVVSPGVVYGDEWETGTFSMDDLKKWVEKSRKDGSVAHLLENDENAYFTALVFGDLAPRVKKFSPENIALSGIPSQKFSRDFPPDYKHKQDPLPGDPFGRTQDIRSRIRILPLSSPQGIEVWCRYLLEKPPYQISENQSGRLLRDLVKIVQDRATAKEETLRRLTAAEIDAIVAAGRSPQGRWIDAQKILMKNSQVFQLPDRVIDFEKGRYAHIEEFDEVWDSLGKNGFVVLSGLPGSGKTTVCQYIAYRFLKEHATNRAYYLNVKSSSSFKEEMDFIAQNAFSNVLFIIDNEHFASTEIELLVRDYVGMQMRLDHKAKLFITSTIKYTRVQEHAAGASELNKATCLGLTSDSKSLKNILNILIQKGMLDPSLPVEAFLSSGHKNDFVIGTALMIAKSVECLKSFPTLRTLLEGKNLDDLLEAWILTQVNHPGEKKYFEDEIAPVFIIGAHGLPIRDNYTNCVKQLHTAGFLRLDESGLFYPSSSKLALLISESNHHGHSMAFDNYFGKHPEDFPIMCEQLQKNRRPRALTDFCKKHFAEIFNLMNGFNPLLINLDGIGKVLRAIHLADKELSNRILKRIAMPEEELNKGFFSNFLNDGNPGKAASVERFFRALYSINPALMRSITEELLTPDSRPAKYLIKLLTTDEYDCRLDTLAACIYAIAKCSKELAVKLYDEVKQSPDFRNKVSKAESDPRALSIWLRFCQDIKLVDRQDAYEKMGQYLPSQRIVDAVLLQSEFNSISYFLNQLRRLHPRLAASVVNSLWEENLESVVPLLTQQNDLNGLVNNLYVLSRLNRRIAIRAAQSVQDNLRSLILHEENYFKIGAAIESLRKNILESVAANAAGAINRDYILSKIINDDRPELVGKFLYNLTVLSPEIAIWFQTRLSFKSFLQKLVPFRLRDVVYLIRGFLFAAENKPAQEEILEEILNNRGLINEINYHWKSADLTEIAFCLTVLMDTPGMNSKIILELIKYTRKNFLDYILRKFRMETSVFHIANGLYGIAKFDADMATEALKVWMEATEKDRKADFYSIVDVGCLLRIAAAIEPLEANRIVDFLRLGKLIVFAAREGNLGRVAIFIRGLYEASRKYALEFINNPKILNNWELSYEQEEEPENIIHYARSVSQVSLQKGGDYLKLVLNGRNNIYQMLEFETNLQLIANWLRVLSHYSNNLVDVNHLDKISNILLTATEYDTRLRSLLEATEALIECGNKELAADFADKVLLQKNQLRRDRSLHDWIGLIHKAIRIERELGFSGFANEFFEGVSQVQFTDILRQENNLVLSSYACFLLLNSNADFPQLRNAASNQKSNILKRAANENNLFAKNIAYIFLDDSVDEIYDISENLECHLWQRGLVALLFRSMFPDEHENPYTSYFNSTPGEIERAFREVDNHVGNLEFGLAMHLAAICRFSRGISSQDAFRREKDESNSSVRWLLTQKPGTADFNKKPYYLWNILKNTVLRSMSLNWGSEVENSNDSIHYNKEHRRDIDVLLS